MKKIRAQLTTKDGVSTLQSISVGTLCYFCISLQFLFKNRAYSFLQSVRWRTSKGLPSPFSYFLASYTVFLVYRIFESSHYEIKIFWSFILDPGSFPIAAAVIPAALIGLLARAHGLYFLWASKGQQHIAQQAIYTAFGTLFLAFTVYFASYDLVGYLISRFPNLRGAGWIAFVWLALPLFLLPTAYLNQVVIKNRKTAKMNFRRHVYEYSGLALYIITAGSILYLSSQQVDHLVSEDFRNSRITELAEKELVKFEDSFVFHATEVETITFGPPLFQAEPTSPYLNADYFSAIARDWDSVTWANDPPCEVEKFYREAPEFLSETMACVIRFFGDLAKETSLMGYQASISSFYISATEVPAAALLFAHIDQGGAASAHLSKKEGPFNRERFDLLKLDHPVSLSLEEMELVLRLLQRRGRAPSGVRLCSIMEWDFATREGKQIIFPWGNSFDIADRYVRSGDVGPVGGKRPTGLGMYDLLGNTKELVVVDSNAAVYAVMGGDGFDDPVDFAIQPGWVTSGDLTSRFGTRFCADEAG